MAFQAAYYSLYGRSETTYEPAMTKAFVHAVRFSRTRTTLSLRLTTQAFLVPSSWKSYVQPVPDMQS